MAYTFKHIDRDVYPKTFLRDVHLSLQFQTVNVSDALRENVKKFFCDSFRIGDVNAESLVKPVSVYSKDEMIRFYFSLNRVILAVKQPTYRSFENIESFRMKAFEYLDLLGVEYLSKIVLYKYNQLEYQLVKSGSVTDVMKHVFSSSLMENMPTEDVLLGLSRWEKALSFNGDDEFESTFSIEYGFRKNSLVSDSDNDALTLKTQIESGNVIIKRDDVMRVLSDFNQILYNGFHWCVTDDIVDEMKKL